MTCGDGVLRRGASAGGDGAGYHRAFAGIGVADGRAVEAEAGLVAGGGVAEAAQRDARSCAAAFARVACVRHAGDEGGFGGVFGGALGDVLE